jgi:hypothetical protein
MQEPERDAGTTDAVIDDVNNGVDAAGEKAKDWAIIIGSSVAAGVVFLVLLCCIIVCCCCL